MASSSSPSSIAKKERVAQAAMDHSREAMQYLWGQDYEQANGSFRKAYALYNRLGNHVKLACVVHQLGVS